MPALVVGIARHIHNLKNPNDLTEEMREKIFNSMDEYINQFSETNKEQVINEIEEIFKTWENHLSFFDDASWGENDKQTPTIMPC